MEVPDDDCKSIRTAGRGAGMDRSRDLQQLLQMGIRRRQRIASPPLREGKEATVERDPADRLVGRSRPGKPRRAAGRVCLDLRITGLGAAYTKGACRSSASFAGQ